METAVNELFERYEAFFRRALAGEASMDEAARLYAGEFIASSPAGVMTGKNDETLKRVMAEGFARYRAQGMKDMRRRGLRVSPIDEAHCIAHVAWTATYVRPGQPDAAIDFDVHYFVRNIGAAPNVFGWVSGDEEAALKQHGIL